MKNLFKLAAVASALAFSANTVNANEKIGFVDPNFLIQNHPLTIEANDKFTKFMKDTESKFAPREKQLAAENKALSDEEKALLDERRKIEEDAQKLQKEQVTLEAAMKKKVAQLEKDAPRLKAKEIQARQNKINAEAKPFQNKVSALQQREVEFGKKAEEFQKRADEFQKKVAAFQEEIAKVQKESGVITPEQVQQKVVEDINAKIKQVAESKGYTLVLPPSVALYAKDGNAADITEEILVAMGGKMPEAPKTQAPAAEVTKPEEVKK